MALQEGEEKERFNSRARPLMWPQVQITVVTKVYQCWDNVLPACLCHPFRVAPCPEILNLMHKESLLASLWEGLIRWKRN